MTALEFWYDFHSPWAYLAATRIEGLASRHGLGVRWRPLHLPRLNEAIKGRRPLEENPAFVAWYKQDLQDWAQLYGVVVRYHPGYPLKPARALRAALRATELGGAAPFALAVFKAYWSESRDISDLNVLGELAGSCGFDGAEIVRAAEDDRYRRLLESNTKEAIARGVFGVPSIFWRDKLFFGNDRLALLEHWLGEGDTRTDHGRDAPGPVTRE
jgi:2-hydroxychromene-2-carboxylate isomerase